jgi:hypothetical protein
MNKLDNNYNYQLQFFSKNFVPGLNAFLIDRYLHSAYPLNTEDISRYNFCTNNESNSLAIDRFIIVFRLASNSPVPVKLTDIKAWPQENNIAVQWKTENEFNIKNYEVERSADGKNFAKVNTTSPEGNNNSALTYNWLDENLATGTYYYRVRSIDNDGSVKYTSIIKVTISNGDHSITIYPNPIKDGIIKIRMTNMEKGKYTVRLLNSIGQVLMKTMLNYPGGENGYKTIDAITSLSKGVYQLEITGPDNTRNLLNVVYD